jgi:hypothetical protein
MGGKSAPAIPPPPPLPPLQPINIMAPSLPPIPKPEPLPIRDEESFAPTTEEIAKKAKLEKDKLKNKPGGPRGTQFTGTSLLLDPEVSEENLYKPLIS